MISISPDITALYKEIDGSKITADIYVPPQETGSLPCLIIIHGGAWMVGASSMINKDQIKDCLDRKWIVVSPNHRLCPQVDVLEGPMTDIRDFLAWIYDGNLDKELKNAGLEVSVNKDKVMSFGTSSGGHLALSLGYDVPRKVVAIYDQYSPASFSDQSWRKKQEDRTPPGVKIDLDLAQKVFDIKPIPTTAGVGLEGQALPPDFSDPRQAFTFSTMSRGGVVKAIYPKGETEGYQKVDPVLNVTSDFPPTMIVHGTADVSVPIHLSHALFKKLQDAGVESEMVEVEGAEHTFSMKMVKGDATWERQRLGFDFLEKIIARKS
ncbi:alpha/beta-hydrolase [Microthyrium microscopicum]|uniref:Alpha/beta-hydrolase n=1 Tax=Microthyrium microscopicum TaxID=703497 RepID=A0A6A6UC15_9PEZI|nr:alpha/beta-hydrolase [Microthyrium microscopicum]